MIFANVLGKSLYQWELGRLFAVPAPKNGTVSRIEFCHKGTKPEPLVPKEDNGLVIAPIPNYLLQESDPIYVYLVYVDENRLETITHYVLSVTPRPKPADYVYTETEVLTWTALDKRIQDLEVAEVPPSDWNATEGEVGHVLNRTHYAERYTAEVIAGVKHTLSGSSSLGAKAKIPIEGGKTYAVNWNGTEYTRVANAVHEVDFSYVQIGGRGDAPFNISATLDSLFVTIQPLDGSTEISVDIYEVGEIVHKLPSKYLPDDIITDEAVASVVKKYMAEHPAALIVTVNNGKASRTPAEIYAYVQAGGDVYLQPEGESGYFALTLAGESEAIFSAVASGVSIAMTVESDCSVQSTFDELVTADHIPTNIIEQINELVDGKLAKIPTGGGVEPLIVTVENDAASHGVDEIGAHVASGGSVYLLYNDALFAFDVVIGDEAHFTVMDTNSVIGIAVGHGGAIRLYHAELAKADKIPTDDHINSLIDTKIAEIPSGGGGSEWRLINTVNITEDVASITIDTDSDGKPFDLCEYFMVIDNSPCVATSSNIYVRHNGSAGTQITRYELFPKEGNTSASVKNYVYACRYVDMWRFLIRYNKESLTDHTPMEMNKNVNSIYLHGNTFKAGRVRLYGR